MLSEQCAMIDDYLRLDCKSHASFENRPRASHLLITYCTCYCNLLFPLLSRSSRSASKMSNPLSNPSSVNSSPEPPTWRPAPPSILRKDRTEIAANPCEAKQRCTTDARSGAIHAARSTRLHMHSELHPLSTTCIVHCGLPPLHIKGNSAAQPVRRVLHVHTRGRS